MYGVGMTRGGGKAVENLNENYYFASRIEQRVKCFYLNGRPLRVWKSSDLICDYRWFVLVKTNNKIKIKKNETKRNPLQKNVSGEINLNTRAYIYIIIICRYLSDGEHEKRNDKKFVQYVIILYNFNIILYNYNIII